MADNLKKVLKVILILLLITTLYTIVSYFYNIHKEQIPENGGTIVPKSQKVEFGEIIPVDFPSGIPIETDVLPSQSYALNYSNQKQLTVVFDSTKTISQNYALYKNFLKQDGWIIKNSYEDAKISFLYGIKGDSDINITINTKTSLPAASSQVSISLLKK